CRRGGPRLRLEVGHGLDARHAQVLRPRPAVPRRPPQPAHLPRDLRQERELRPAAVARRGGPLEGLAAREDAGEPEGAARRPAPALLGPGRAAGQEAPVHGRRDRSMGGVEPRREPRLAPAREARAPGPPGLRARLEPPLSRRAGAPRARCQAAGGLRVARLLGRGEERARDPAPAGGSGRRGGGDRAQLHARPAHGLPGRPARRRVLAGDPQQRRGDLRRKRRGQPGRNRSRGGAGRPVALVGPADPAAARRVVPEARFQRAADAGRHRGRAAALRGRRGRRGGGGVFVRRGRLVRGAVTERFVCIHEHFYQPPRENPWLEAIERQPSARPYHDWNERITAECYGPNAEARLLDERGRLIRVVDNYSRISFNFGPTLLSWLEGSAPRLYRAIQEADARS